MKYHFVENAVIGGATSPRASPKNARKTFGNRATASRSNNFFPLSPQERREFETRKAIRAKGKLVPLEGEALRAWLKEKYPRLTFREARAARLSERFDLSLHERFLERSRESDFAKRHARIATLSSHRSSAPVPAPAAVIPQRPRWRGNDAEFCFETRQHDNLLRRLGVIP